MFQRRELARLVMDWWHAKLQNPEQPEPPFIAAARKILEGQVRRDPPPTTLKPVKGFVEIESTERAPGFWGITFPSEPLNRSSMPVAPAATADFKTAGFQSKDQPVHTAPAPSTAPPVHAPEGKKPVVPHAPAEDWDITFPPKPSSPSNAPVVPSMAADPKPKKQSAGMPSQIVAAGAEQKDIALTVGQRKPRHVLVVACASVCILIAAAVGGETLLQRRASTMEAVGRRSGSPREIEIWFTDRDGRYYIISETGERAQWVRNIRANPRVRFRVGYAEFAGSARIVSTTAEPALSEAVRSLSEAKYGWSDGLIVELLPDSGSRPG